MSETSYPAMQRHIPGDQNPHKPSNWVTCCSVNQI
jgi:hypothetical protein